MKYLIGLFLLYSLQAAGNTENVTCNVRQSAFNCLLCNCYHETRGEPLEGKIAVAKTVLSRMGHDSFPDTACGVIFQPAQFSWTRKSVLNISVKKPEDKQSLQECRNAVNTALDEGANGLIYFYNPRVVTPAWTRQAQSCGRVGDHVYLVPRGNRCPRTVGANATGNGNNRNQRQQGRPSGVTR